MALVGVGVGHMVWGWCRWMDVVPKGGMTGKERKRRWWGINGVVVFIAGVWMAGGLGVVGMGGKEGGWVGRVYDALFERVGLLG